MIEETKEKLTHDQDDIKAHNIMAALSYFGILLILPWFFASKSPFVQFHLRQGIVVFLFFIFSSFSAWIPLIGWLLWPLSLVASIYGCIQALQGKYWELPYLGKYAKNLKI